MRECYYGPRLIIPVASLPALDKCYSIFADATAFCPVIHKGKVSHLGNTRRIPFLHSDFTRKAPHKRVMFCLGAKDVVVVKGIPKTALGGGRRTNSGRAARKRIFWQQWPGVPGA